MSIAEAFKNVRGIANLVHLVDSIYLWGIKRGITVENGATGLSQIKKLHEELEELEEALHIEDPELIKDAIGDMYVVLQQVARLSGVALEDCLQMAWDSIKDRKGQMRFGIYVKQEDIDLIGEVAFEEAKDAAQLLDWIAVAKESSDED